MSQRTILALGALGALIIAASFALSPWPWTGLIPVGLFFVYLFATAED